MKRLRVLKLAVWGILPWGLLAVLQSCANPMPCPGEQGAPMDMWGNEVDIGGGGNHEQRLNTDCYYGRGDNGKAVLLTQKPQTGFWNSSIFRTDETTPINTPHNDNEPSPPDSHGSVESNNNSTELESMVTASGDNSAPIYKTAAPAGDPPPPEPEPMHGHESVTESDALPFAAPEPEPTPLSPTQKLYYRSGKVKGECGPMNVYREAYVPPCPVQAAAPPPPPTPVPIQRTYIQNNYPPVAVQTGEPPAQAAGAFLGGVGEDVLGAGALTYAIRYRPDVTNSYANAGASSTSAPLHGRPGDPGHGFPHHPPQPPHGTHGFDPHPHPGPRNFGEHPHPQPHPFEARHEPGRFDEHHHPEPRRFDAQRHPEPKDNHESLLGLLDK